jgi:tetrapyrrole methylase family protein/MazG family protein
LSACITVVGLGSGDESRLSLGVYRKLKEAETVYVRTERHPVVDFLRREHIPLQTFDSLYESRDRFEEVYEAIAHELLERAEAGEEIVYAVPGHPMVAEASVRLLRERCPARGIALAIMGGESFLDEAFVRFGLDPIGGFQVLDGSLFDAGRCNPGIHTIIAQVYDAFTASEVKLGLMEKFPDDYPIVVGQALGVEGREQIRQIPLYELDRLSEYGNLFLIWVPASDREDIRGRSFDRLHEIVRILRSPEGCPWDREQTHASIRKNLIEETYEVLETIDDDDPAAMCEELGDLLLQVVMHAQMEEEAGSFTVYDVIAEINRKLIRRHPHVFGERQAGNAEEALRNWQEVKAREKRDKGIDPARLSVLSGIPRDLPGLMKALKLQKKAARVGFDWGAAEGAVAKAEEEIAELKEAIRSEDPARKTDELGDVLFSMVNIARLIGVDPEEAISSTNRKFVRRFSYMEEQLRLKGRKIEQTDLQEMELLWQQAKKN